MNSFVDPRDGTPPVPPDEPDRFERDPLAPLRRLCRDGRVYEIEQWIRAGRAVAEDEDAFLPRRNEASPLRIAVKTGQHSLCRLLLANGCDPNRESRCLLDTALETRRRDILELLWDAGADPRRICFEILFETYDLELYERFWRAGIDFTEEHALAAFLQEHPGNKPLLGFTKRHLAETPRLRNELNIALGHCIEQSKERGIALCLWAGADPHARAVDLSYWRPGDDEPDEDGEEPCYTALYRAADMNRLDLLRRFKPDPAVDDFTDLYRVARSVDAVEYLSGIQPAKNLTAIVVSQLSRIEHPFAWRNKPAPSESVLAAIFLTTETRWEGVSKPQIEGIRRQILRVEDGPLKDLLTLLRDPAVCDPAIYAELTRTSAVKDRIQRIGVGPAAGRTTKRPLRAR